jgi:uncharacterized protein with HEPN domain
MPWRRITLWTVATTLLIVAVAVIFLFTADLGFLKPQIERRVTAASGRNFSIDGELSVRLGRRATVTAEEVRWQNAEWAGSRDMLEIRRFEIDVDLLSAVRGPFVVERVLARGARIDVARDPQDESNWAMFEAPAKEPEPQRDEDIERGWIVRQLDVSDVDVRISRPAPLSVHVRSLQQTIGEDDVVTTALDALANGKELSLTSRLGTWTSLLQQGRIDFALEAQVDRIRVTGQGYVDSLTEPRLPAFEFAVSGPSMNDLYVMAGLGEHGTGDVNLEGSLEPRDNDGPLALTIAGNAGETRIDAAGTFSDLGHFEQAELTARAAGPNLSRILGLFGLHEVSEVPFALSLDLERDGSRLSIRDATLDIGDAKAVAAGQLPEFPSLGNASVSGRIEGPAIERLRRLAPIPDGIRGPFLAELELDATDAQAEAFRVLVRTTLGELSATGTLGPAPEHFGSRANVRFAGESLAAIAAAWGVEGPGAVPVALSGDVAWMADGIHLRQAVTAAGDHEATIVGVIGTAAELRGSALELRLEGNSVADFASTVYPMNGMPGQPYRISAKLRVDDSGYTVQELSASVGDTGLTGDIFVSRRKDLTGSRASLSMEGPALEQLLPALGTRRIRPGRFRLSGNAAIANGTLELERLRFEREFAALAADVEVGWPLSFDHAKLDLHSSGENVRALIGAVGPLHLADLPYGVEFRGTRNGSRWSIEALDATLGDARLNASGTVDYGESLEATRLNLTAAIPGLARLGSIDGEPLRDRSVKLGALVTGQDHDLAVDNLNLEIDEGSIGGSIRIRPGPVPEVNVNLHSDRFALQPLARAAREEPPPARTTDARLIPDTPVDLDGLRAVNGTFRLRIAALERADLYLRNFGVDAILRDGTLDVPQFGFDGRTGRLDATANVSADSRRYAFSMTARELTLGVDETNTDDPLTGDIDSRLTSSGDNLRAIARNLGGYLLVDTGGGRMRNYKFLQALYGNLLEELLSTINPFHKAGEFTTFECIILPVEIVDGRASSASNILVLTDKIRILSQAVIDLDDEAMDVSVRTLPRQSLGISAAEIVNPYVKIVGTLTAPRLSLDQKGVLVAGGAAVATGGLSVLAKAAWDRLSRDENPCEEAGAAARKALARHMDQSAMAR